jgi:hypothetical protein
MIVHILINQIHFCIALEIMSVMNRSLDRMSKWILRHSRLRNTSQSLLRKMHHSILRNRHQAAVLQVNHIVMHLWDVIVWCWASRESICTRRFYPLVFWSRIWESVQTLTQPKIFLRKPTHRTTTGSKSHLFAHSLSGIPARFPSAQHFPPSPTMSFPPSPSFFSPKCLLKLSFLANVLIQTGHCQ